MKTVAQLDEENYFICSTVADESPLEPGVYLIPRGCIDATPPDLQEGKKAKWENGWVYEEIKYPVTPAPVADPPAGYVEKRRAEYPSIFEYIDGIVKNDQAQVEKYIQDCLAVKSKHPKD